METVQAFTLLAAAIIFGICGAGTAVAFGNLGGKLIESSARMPRAWTSVSELSMLRSWMNPIGCAWCGVSRLNKALCPCVDLIR